MTRFYDRLQGLIDFGVFDVKSIQETQIEIRSNLGGLTCKTDGGELSLDFPTTPGNVSSLT